MKNTKETTPIVCKSYHSPCGELLLGSTGGMLCLCNWQAGRNRDGVDRRLQRSLGARYENGTSEVIEQAALELDEYFAGHRREFSVPLLFVGTEFQKAVWNELLKIPYGSVNTYGSQAARMGVPRAVRAVAGANGANALSIFAPCHRIIGTDGTLTGYGGGLEAKKMLLELERRYLRN